ncbi:hypothetical protein Psal006b_00695 [Piscirickettsia salmonis]|uniref:Major Facilitator Superfamily protein n=1 Tax=Piscirickettsia salmonis TaxID=1238 RepID=A0AAC8VJM5_PISSA|nr:hypothetical protein [Piscirickettsia salmonis]ALB23682.1 major Facilitator Superfamily protein [Piscirickettsia salmonis]QGN97728.1 hypothetical protein Psal006b_00695 [Piscirickettsia salmonis]QGO01326.1 hypothetical protein Psal008_00696 [Piscirickettsia salmonis]QGO12045.1 hypothetical protein Psal010b_00695 [Piscirickettsia salmonis]QGO19065.1 hypothetical protein Psal013_00691 [Piscirickettsia salmonis]
MALYFGLPRDIYIIALTEFVLALGRFVFPFLSLLYSATVSQDKSFN